MPRPPSIIPTVRWTATLPEHIAAQIDTLLLGSYGRVPYGARGEFIERLWRQAVATAELDMGPYVGSEPGVLVVRANVEAIEALKLLLEQKR